MNIIVLYLGKRGSAPLNAFEMTQALVKKGCNLTCILSEYIENKVRFVEIQKNNKNLKLVFIKTYKTILQFVLRTINIVHFLRLRILIINYKPDYIYIPMITAWSAILCFFLTDMKIATTIHEPKRRVGDNIFMDMMSFCNIKKSNKVIVLSKDFISITKKCYGIPEEKICLIPLSNYNYYLPREWHKSNTKIYNKIIFFGRITKYKGLEVLLKAMYLIKQSNREIILKIVGDGELSYKEKAILSNLGKQVELVNRWIAEDEIYTFFQDVDITVLPYIEASQSGVIMLSYSFMKPVITTGVGGLAGQVFSGAGIIIPPNDEKILAKTILSMYDNPAGILKMGSSAYDFATKELTWDHSAELLLNFLSR
jgi:glycosyltransferase involved in cell wall biosynthesis